MSKMSERAIDKMNKNNKLKTLEDIWKETETLNTTYTPTEIHDIRRNDFYRIRKLAKQHIQAIQLTKDKTTNIADIIIADRKIEWIKYFFNLKEVNNVE